MASASVTIDAGVLAVPGLNGAAEDAHRYIEALLDWAKLLDEPWVAYCENNRRSWSRRGYKPSAKRTSDDRSLGIQEYDVNTVAIVIDRLLVHTPSFETYFRIRDALTEDVSTTPDILQLCTGNGLQTDLARCLVLIAILRKHCGEDILENALILRKSPSRRVHVRALVHEIEHERDGLDGMLPKPPEYFEGEVLACDNFRGLLACVDESSVLHSATDDGGVEIAIRIGLYKSRLARFMEPDWDDMKRMHIGPQFVLAMHQCCIDAPASFPANALRAISEAIDKQNMRRAHALRTGSGGNDPQIIRRRDNAKGWRRDVDWEYHLHYWESEDGTIELASIGVHGDLTIPE